MIHDCDNCKHAETPAFFEPCASCGGSSYWEPYVQTNGDRIRAMSDEELAKFLRHPSPFTYCCPPSAASDEFKCNNDGCKACWIDWLKQETQA